MLPTPVVHPMLIQFTVVTQNNNIIARFSIHDVSPLFGGWEEFDFQSQSPEVRSVGL